MECIGWVKAIVNDDLILCELTETLPPGTTLTVYAELRSARLSELELDRLIVPKGQVELLARQSGQTFLATLRIVENDTTTDVENALLPRFMFRSVSREKPQRYRAHVDRTQSLNIPLMSGIQVGDKLTLEVE